MGQYFVMVNKTKKQFINPSAFNDGSKGVEIILNGNTLKALGFLLLTSSEFDNENSMYGYWSGDEIVIVGDYDNSGLYSVAYKTYTDITSTVAANLMGQSYGDKVFPNYSEKTLYNHIKEHPIIPFNELSTTGRPKNVPEPEPETKNREPQLGPDELELF
jgi:hypothetical protein